VVTEDGRPTGLEVIESAGEVLDQALLEALADWRFAPARLDGEPVRVRWRVRQHFLLGR
jgi:TonB family protein